MGNLIFSKQTIWNRVSQVGIAVVLANFRAYRKLKSGAQVHRYSVARTFQIRENVVITKVVAKHENESYCLGCQALLKISSRVIALNTPLFLLSICQFFLFQENIMNPVIFHAFFDFIISLQVWILICKCIPIFSYPLIIISFLPFSDVIFEKSLKRMRYGTQIFNLFAIFPCNSRKEIQRTYALIKNQNT